MGWIARLLGRMPGRDMMLEARFADLAAAAQLVAAPQAAEVFRRTR